jgi:recombination protein RecT
MSTDVVTTGATAAPTLRNQIQKMEHQFELAAPRGVEARQIVRDALTAISQNPDLLQCEPQSVLGGLMTMAQLGLRVGVLGHGWLIPFNTREQIDGKWTTVKKAQLVIGYQGLVALAHRSGQIRSLSARTVHANDHFNVEYGVNENLTHRPATGDRGEVVGYYAVVRFLPDGHSFYYLTKAEAEVYRDRYAMAKKGNGEVVGPWKTEFDAMAMKTCVRQLSKFMPKGTDLAVGLAADETVRVNIDPGTPPELVSSHVEPDVVESTVQLGDESPGTPTVSIVRSES